MQSSISSTVTRPSRLQSPAEHKPLQPLMMLQLMNVPFLSESRLNDGTSSARDASRFADRTPAMSAAVMMYCLGIAPPMREVSAPPYTRRKRAPNSVRPRNTDSH